MSDCDYVQGCRRKGNAWSYLKNCHLLVVKFIATFVLGFKTHSWIEIVGCSLMYMTPNTNIHWAFDHVNMFLISFLDCPSGYLGPFCSDRCRYPNYGIECQSECLCEEQHCNHVTGCLTLSIDTSRVILILKYECFSFAVDV